MGRTHSGDICVNQPAVGVRIHRICDSPALSEFQRRNWRSESFSPNP